MMKRHAEHNEHLCDHLIEVKGYNDWVVTTAFYSALQYMQGKIFPLVAEGRTYHSFDSYYIHYKKSSRAEKHRARIELVQRHLPQAEGAYRWLYDTCMKARYYNYKISDARALKAKEYLGIVKSHC